MSLGIMNLLPLPALDGGHLVMLFIESIRKKPLSPSISGSNIYRPHVVFILTVAVTYKMSLSLLPKHKESQIINRSRGTRQKTPRPLA
jgi:regulator of sigma E protease